MRLRRSIASAALLAALLAPPLALGGPTSELNELRARIEALKKRLTASEESRTDAADALRESEQAISGINRRLFDLTAKQKALQAELAALEAQRAALDHSVAEQRSRLALQLHQRYLAGEPEPLRLLANRQDPNDLARQMHYLGYVYRARVQAIEQLRQDLRQLQALVQRYTHQSEALAALQTEQVQRRGELERQKRERVTVLAKISTDVDRQRRQFDKLKQDEQRLTRLVEQLAKELARKKKKAVRQAAKATGKSAERSRTAAATESAAESADTAFRSLKGQLQLPIVGELANRFGDPREGGGIAWKGLFIRAKTGQQVRAVGPGRVVFADWLRGFGNLMIVSHDGGFMSLYANNEALYRQVGDEVSSGDTIASVGSSGGSPETGLYFELRYQGRPFDPLSWVNHTK